MSNPCTWDRAGVLRRAAASGLVVAFIGAVAFADAPAWEPYRGPVNAPDVMGGYMSTEIIVRVAPGAAPVQTDERHWSFGPTPQTVAIAGVLAEFGAASVAPSINPAPANAELAASIGLDRYFTITLPAGTDTPALVQQLNAIGGAIESAELNGIGGVLTMPNDPSFNLQYGLLNTGQTISGNTGIAGADIDAMGAWAITTGSSDVIVAVLDTGISTSHPDLQANLVPGWNVQANNANTNDSWLISHGTHCAGIIGAVGNNSVGVTGVAWEVSLMPLLVLGTFGTGSESDISNGLTWSTDNGAHIASMSLGFPGTSSLIAAAAIYAHQSGVLLVAATGNTPTDPVSVPAALPEVVAVGATDNRDQIGSFVSTGPEMSVVAPGVDVYSTWDTLFSANTYTYQTGTSMACPHVAGVAALMLSVNPALTNIQLRDLLESTADDLGTPGWNPIYGHGRVNAAAAVQAAMNAGQPCIADLNNDGVVDADDFFLYLNLFADGDPITDMNGDGVIDADDFFLYLNLFAHGC